MREYIPRKRLSLPAFSIPRWQIPWGKTSCICLSLSWFFLIFSCGKRHIKCILLTLFKFSHVEHIHTVIQKSRIFVLRNWNSIPVKPLSIVFLLVPVNHHSPVCLREFESDSKYIQYLTLKTDISLSKYCQPSFILQYCLIFFHFKANGSLL